MNAAGTKAPTAGQRRVLARPVPGRLAIGLPALVIALAATASFASSAAAECFRYGEVVTLSGRYFAEVAPAADGVTRDPINDASRRATLLVLASPLCVNADQISGGVSTALSIQLSCPDTHSADGTELSIEGRLVGAHTGNGQVPVLLMCL
jgi:hypothetical protein